MTGLVNRVSDDVISSGRQTASAACHGLAAAARDSAPRLRRCRPGVPRGTPDRREKAAPPGHRSGPGGAAVVTVGQNAPTLSGQERIPLPQ
jgi:hypothetical protein